MIKKTLVIIGARGIGDLIYHLPLLRSLHKTYQNKIYILSNKVSKAKHVFKNESFYHDIRYFDNDRYGIIKTIKNIISFKNLINSYDVDQIILTSNATRLILPVILSNIKKKKIFGQGHLLLNKDKSLNHLTISERLIIYTKNLKLKRTDKSFFLNSKKLNKTKNKKKIFISIDSHHDQNNWDIKNYVDLVDKLSKKNIIYINFSPSKKYFLKYFNNKNLIFTYKYNISKIINIIDSCDVVIGNESGPVCLGSALKKKVHAIYIPIHTKPESKIIYSKNIYYNTKKLSSKLIQKKILDNLY